jgi:methylthioribose-1-phosphate isomerase
MARTHEHDPTRREFFRTFGRATVRQAGAVAGAAAELRRSSLEAARVLFDPQDAAADSPAVATATREVQPAIDESQPDATFRSAYRFTGSEIVALDARQLPDRVATLVLSEPSEVASAIRAGAINGGPVLAEVAAYAMAMAARAAIERPPAGRDQQVRAAANTLRGAKPEVHALTWAVQKLESLYLDLAGQATGPTDLAERMQSEADSIALGNSRTNAEIGRIGARQLLALDDDPINLLIHGDMSPLSCGLIGMGTALIQGIRDAGRDVHAWVTECAPSREGGRVAAFGLRQLDVPFNVIPDTAVGWLLDQHRVDALVLRGDRVAANGDVGVLIGGLSAALLARANGVPVYVLAPQSAFDPVAALAVSATPTGDVVRADLISSGVRN